MARPRVFVSSTYYDLKHLRSSLENFVESLGYDPVLSEKGDIAYVPDAPLDESCYREVRNTDIYVLIIGGRYGSERSGGTKAAKDFFDRYDSITKMEYKSAVDQDIPIYILIERSVYADYENFLRNRDNTSFNYAHVDSVNIFHLIEEILAKRRNNPVFQFDRYNDIEAWLREQWAGFFKELLARASSQRQIASLSAQVAQLSEINQTLKRYLEEVVSKVAPEESVQLIQHESQRLEQAGRIAAARANDLVSYLSGFGIAEERVIGAIATSTTIGETIDKLIDSVLDDRRAPIDSLRTNPAARKDFEQVKLFLETPNIEVTAARSTIGQRHEPVVKPTKAEKRNDR